MKLEELGVVGNCQFSALNPQQRRRGLSAAFRDSIPSLYFPPCSIVRNGGSFRINRSRRRRPERCPTCPIRTSWKRNSETSTGSFRVIDFAPRFLLYGRAFRPTQLVRIIEPIEGTPRISVLCEPRLGWSKERPSVTQGSHHIQFDGFASPLRLTTDLPLSCTRRQSRLHLRAVST